MGNLEVSEKPISLVAEEQQQFDDPYQLDLILITKCTNRENRLTSTAIHTTIRLDIKHSIALIDAINWALFNAGLILNINTRLRNYVGHASPYSYICLDR